MCIINKCHRKYHSSLVFLVYYSDLYLFTTKQRTKRWCLFLFCRIKNFSIPMRMESKQCQYFCCAWNTAHIFAIYYYKDICRLLFWFCLTIYFFSFHCALSGLCALNFVSSFFFSSAQFAFVIAIYWWSCVLLVFVGFVLVLVICGEAVFLSIVRCVCVHLPPTSGVIRHFRCWENDQWSCFLYRSSCSNSSSYCCCCCNCSRIVAYSSTYRLIIHFFCQSH